MMQLSEKSFWRAALLPLRHLERFMSARQRSQPPWLQNSWKPTEVAELVTSAPRCLARPDVAATGKLNMVTAAAPDLLEKVEPFLSVLGKTWRVGDDPRIAHVAKIAGNFMIGCAIETMAESAALISLNGGDPGLFLTMLAKRSLTHSFIAPMGRPLLVASLQEHPLGYSYP